MTTTNRELGDQIRKRIATLPTIAVEEACSPALEDVLDATEDILYPEGLKTEAEYERLIVISKAACRAIGYSDEEVTLLPPVVGFRQRGTYLKKMPVITDEAIATLIEKLAESDYELISSPYVAITRKMLIGGLAYEYLQKTWRELTGIERRHLAERCDEVAKKLGWSIRSFDYDPAWPAGEVGYTKPMTPNIEACREAVTRVLNNWHGHHISYILSTGLQAAFANRVKQDPEEFISYETWRDLFDQLGYIYDREQTELIPKPLNLPLNARDVLTTAISGLRTYNHPKIGPFLIKDDLMQAAKEALELTITKPRLEQLISDGIIGRVLIKLGYQITARWLSRHDFAKLPIKPPIDRGAEVFCRAIQIDQHLKTPTFAKGFTIHSPALLRDETTLVYMELLGPRILEEPTGQPYASTTRTITSTAGDSKLPKKTSPSHLKLIFPAAGIIGA